MGNSDATETIRIDSLAYGGAGIGRIDGKVCFVPYSAAGDLLRVRILVRSARYLRAEIIEIVEAGDTRRTPSCAYFGRCGGCTWQHVSYDAQLAAKQEGLAQSLRRIAKLEAPILPIVRSPAEWAYRARARLHRADDGKVGYFKARSRSVVEIDACPILEQPLERQLGHIRAALRGRTLVPAGSGTIEIECDESGDVRTVNLTDEDGDLDGGLGFQQANRKVNRILQECVRSYVSGAAPVSILDLYCGNGNISLAVAEFASRIVGYDSSERSVKEAKRNARLAGIADASFLCAPIERALPVLRASAREFSWLFLDPPRKGLKGIAGEIGALQIQHIVYVSCSPPALARDLAELADAGYAVELVQPLDMFPQSYHLETIALLKLAAG